MIRVLFGQFIVGKQTLAVTKDIGSIGWMLAGFLA